MSYSIVDILSRLESVAAYTGNWTLLQEEAPVLRQRLDELRQRETRLDDLLVVALVGGSGVGKSTLLNALAGDELAKTSEFRPCTSRPTAYHPPGARLDLSEEWDRVSGSALEHLVIVDTPDSDTIAREHRAIVAEVLSECDLICMCSDSEKYLDEATWSLLRPLQQQRALVCIETKASEAPSIREDWLKRLKENGFTSAGYFRVNSRRTFDRKLSGAEPQDDEYDFAALEDFLQRELSQERIRRIKRSNAAGLLSKTLATLESAVHSSGDGLAQLEETVAAYNKELAQDSFEIVGERLFAEPHLWNYALGRELCIRAKGFVGSLYRILESLRTLPARMTSWSLWPGRPSSGHGAAALLSEQGLIEESLSLSSDLLESRYRSKEGDITLRMTSAGFTTADRPDGFEAFNTRLNQRVAELLRGPARERIVARARMLSNWPVAILLDIPPLAFLGVTGYTVVTTYFRASPLAAAFFVHASAVLAIVLGLEILGMSVTARALAWSARRRALADLRVTLAADTLAFDWELEALREAREMIDLVRSLRDAATISEN